MRKIILLLLVFSLVLGCIGGENTVEMPEKTETPVATEISGEETSIAWIDNVEQAKEMAKNYERLIFMDFTADSCVWCREMEKTTYKDNGVITLLNENFVPVYFDLDIETNEEIYKTDYHKYVKGSLPTMLILDDDAKPLYRIVGYKTGEQLIELLNTVLEEINQ